MGYRQAGALATPLARLVVDPLLDRCGTPVGATLELWQTSGVGRSIALILAFGVGVLAARPAGACSFAPPTPHEVAASSDDTTPPAALQTPGVSVSRGHGPEGGACSREMTSCDDAGRIGIHVLAPEDNRTPADRMGYSVALVSGSLPEGAAIVSPVRTMDGAIWLTWTDGATDDQESIAFTLELRAMDEAGNVSEPVRVSVRDEDDGGCRMASRTLDASWMPSFALALLALAGLRRAARAARGR